MTSILKACLGVKGLHKVFGYDVEVRDDESQGTEKYKSKIRNLSRQVIHSISGTYTHTLVHEVAHAAAFRLVTDNPFKRTTKKDLKITMYTNGDGATITPKRFLDSTGHTIYRVAGPVMEVAICGLEILGGLALKNSYAGYYLMAIGAKDLFGQVISCAKSACKEDDGDFGLISKLSGKAHLIAASSALLAECALIGAAAYFLGS